MVDDIALLKSIKKHKFVLGEGRDSDFLMRIYKRGLDFYKNRIKSLGFINKSNVLDAGCGFGQWSFALAELNNKVSCVDISDKRIALCNKVKNDLNIDNVIFYQSDITKLNYQDKYFDAIFCFSTIYYADYKKTLKEFYRLLKKGGILYICTNGIGWYFYNLIQGKNASKDFSPRKYAIETFAASLRYSLSGKKKKGTSLVMSPNKTKKFMKKIGFQKVLAASEGKIKINEDFDVKNIYPAKFMGLPNVFEIYAVK